MAWYLNPALTRFRNEVNSRWPNRDKRSDGTIGDLAHQATNSDHNPDPDGSVDAWDMDNDGVDVNACIAAAIKHESIQYVIWNRRITSRSWGLGVWRAYDGPSPHTEHVHFNTRPSHENSSKPWFTEDDMPLEAADVNAIAVRILGDGGMQQLFSRVEALASGRDPHNGGQPNVLHQRLLAVAAAVGQVDEQVAAKLQEELSAIDAAVAAARSEVADVDEQVVARLGASDLTAVQKADLLRPVLGDDSVAVGALLAQG